MNNNNSAVDDETYEYKFEIEPAVIEHIEIIQNLGPEQLRSLGERRYKTKINEHKTREGNYKHSSLKQLIPKIIWRFLVCCWFYCDISLDLYTCYNYYSKSKMEYFCLTLIFIFLPILINILVLISDLMLNGSKEFTNKYLRVILVGKSGAKCSIYKKIVESILLRSISIIILFIILIILPTDCLLGFLNFTINSIKIHREKNNNNKKETNELERCIKSSQLSYDFLKFRSVSEMVYETIPQLFLQMYILFDNGLDQMSNEYHHTQYLRIISGFIGILIICVISTQFTKFIVNDYILMINDNKIKFTLFSFIIPRLISNFLFFTSLLASTIAILLTYKIVALILISIYVFIGFAFYLIDDHFKRLDSFKSIIIHVRIYSFKMFSFYESIKLINFSFSWLFIFIMSFLFFTGFHTNVFTLRIEQFKFLPKYEKIFYLNEFYIKIALLTYICISLCLTFLIENFLIKRIFLIKKEAETSHFEEESFIAQQQDPVESQRLADRTSGSYSSTNNHDHHCNNVTSRSIISSAENIQKESKFENEKVSLKFIDSEDDDDDESFS